MQNLPRSNVIDPCKLNSLSAQNNSCNASPKSAKSIQSDLQSLKLQMLISTFISSCFASKQKLLQIPKLQSPLAQWLVNRLKNKMLYDAGLSNQIKEKIMGLYNREYTRSYNHSQAMDNALVNFVKTTYKFFAGSLLLGTLGALFGFMFFETVVTYRWVFFIAEIAALFGLMFSRGKPGLNLAMLFAFTTLSGVTLVPLLGFVIARNGVFAVAQALGMTTIIFGIMSIYAIKTKSDLANMGKILFISLIVVFVCSLINMFLGSPVFQTIIAGAGAILFSLYVAYDTQNIIRGAYASPIDAAVSLYLDFLNIFVSLLQLFGILGSNRD